MRQIILLITITMLLGCVPSRELIGTSDQVNPEAVAHAVKCYEAMEGKLPSPAPVVDVYVGDPDVCAGHDTSNIKGCANKDVIVLIEGRYLDDNKAQLDLKEGHRLFAHEYMHVLYDTFQPDVPIDFHHDIFHDQMNSHLECNFIPRQYVN